MLEACIFPLHTFKALVCVFRTQRVAGWSLCAGSSCEICLLFVTGGGLGFPVPDT